MDLFTSNSCSKCNNYANTRTSVSFASPHVFLSMTVFPLVAQSVRPWCDLPAYGTEFPLQVSRIPLQCLLPCPGRPAFKSASCFHPGLSASLPLFWLLSRRIHSRADRSSPGFPSSPRFFLLLTRSSLTRSAPFPGRYPPSAVFSLVLPSSPLAVWHCTLYLMILLVVDPFTLFVGLLGTMHGFWPGLSHASSDSFSSIQTAIIPSSNRRNCELYCSGPPVAQSRTLGRPVVQWNFSTD
ncbi:hypothetical protein K523DRAFT_4284 [Schizophyllum commune Tattone D]|nr:hypothetical protein K523DRAFT_4284 [Schizophyllum commune Tattone D]